MVYLRPAHAERHIPNLKRFIKQNPLGLFITATQPTEDFPSIQCTHIPWLLDLQHDISNDEELGTMRGHMARQNPHAKALIQAISSQSAQAAQDGYGTLESEISIMFTGPTHSYVTPQFYTETKPATGKVVPTWNYAAVQVYGTLRAYWDPHSAVTDAFLRRAVDDLTKHAERHIKRANRDSAWEVSDAPENYVGLLRKNIIGVEVEVKRLEGKWKMSQEMGSGDRQGIVKGFEGIGTDEGRTMAELVAERGRMKDEAAKERRKEAA